MFVFFATRIVFFPYIIWSAHYETENIERSLTSPLYLAGCGALGLVYCLYGLQLFWGGLIVRVLIKLIRGGHVEDNRSDDEGGADNDKGYLKNDSEHMKRRTRIEKDYERKNS